MWRLVLASLFSAALASPYNPTQYDVVTNANGQIVGAIGWWLFAHYTWAAGYFSVFVFARQHIHSTRHRRLYGE